MVVEAEAPPTEREEIVFVDELIEFAVQNSGSVSGSSRF